MDGAHTATQQVPELGTREASVFNDLLRPDDSYDENGRYWADMSIGERIKFVSKVDSQEARRELGVIGGMFKKDPFSPVSAYFHNMVIPGAGLLLEGLARHVITRVRFTDCN